MAIGSSLDISSRLCYSVLNFITEDFLKQIKTFWQVVREFWKTGKTGIALFLISFFALIYGYIAMEFEITQGWKGHVSVQNVLKRCFGIYPRWWGIRSNDNRRHRSNHVIIRLYSSKT